MPPLRIVGNWREGYALDYHTVSSIHTHDDEFGRPRFETKRTPLGELLYRLKYRREDAGAEPLADAAAALVRSWNRGVQVIVPVPPSKARSRQPLALVARALGQRLSIPVANAVYKAQGTPELKDVNDRIERLKMLQGAHTVARALVEGKKVLLLDDLYQSGATMNAVAGALYAQGGASDVYALALTLARR
ncbi:MAG: ComF family protein [Candidatus Acidiferrales bacterium]